MIRTCYNEVSQIKYTFNLVTANLFIIAPQFKLHRVINIRENAKTFIRSYVHFNQKCQNSTHVFNRSIPKCRRKHIFFLVHFHILHHCVEVAPLQHVSVRNTKSNQNLYRNHLANVICKQNKRELCSSESELLRCIEVVWKTDVSVFVCNTSMCSSVWLNEKPLQLLTLIVEIQSKCTEPFSAC